MNETYEIESVTPAKAAEWLANNTFDRQRSMREHHVLTLAMEMEAGNFIPHSAVVFAQCGNERYLVDGQHRLNAIILADVTVEMPVLVKGAESRQQIERWYGSIDQGLKRSTRDAIKAQNLHEELGLSERHAGRLSGAVKLIASGFTEGGKGYERRTAGRSNIVISDLMREWAKEGKEYYRLVSGGEVANMYLFDRAAVIACGLLTLRYRYEEASEFWEGIAKDDGLPAKNPRKRFLIWLLKNKEKPQTTARAFAVAWKAFLEDREMKLLRFDPTAPLSIAGVPPLDEISRPMNVDAQRLDVLRRFRKGQHAEL